MRVSVICRVPSVARSCNAPRTYNGPFLIGVNVVGWSGSGDPDQFVGFFNRPREVVAQATVRF